jgi:hypothetical protein
MGWQDIYQLRVTKDLGAQHMNKAEQQRADAALQMLMVLRDVAEAYGHTADAEMIGGLISALKTGGDHPLLDSWSRKSH